MKEVTFEEFLKMFDERVHGAIRRAIDIHDAEGFIVFENQAMDSSHLGERTAVVFGPTCTYKSPEEAEGRWLNDLPSQRQYPVAWTKV